MANSYLLDMRMEIIIGMKVHHAMKRKTLLYHPQESAMFR
jgi:hypothetical protein